MLNNTNSDGCSMVCITSKTLHEHIIRFNIFRSRIIRDIHVLSTHKDSRRGNEEMKSVSKEFITQLFIHFYLITVRCETRSDNSGESGIKEFCRIGKRKQEESISSPPTTQ